MSDEWVQEWRNTPPPPNAGEVLDDTPCYTCPHPRHWHVGDQQCTAEGCPCNPYSRPDGTR